MQFKSTFVIAALATLAAAGQGGQCEPASSCSTGPIQCCESLTTSTSAPAVAALTLIGLVLGSTAANLGLSCTSLVGGTCNGQAVCCSDNSHGGVVSVGCIPVQL